MYEKKFLERRTQLVVITGDCWAGSGEEQRNMSGYPKDNFRYIELDRANLWCSLWGSPGSKGGR
jgi:hypothetical protein